jgi:ADP-ribose pyrophosphatase YjhB (NUDIX family)
VRVKARAVIWLEDRLIVAEQLRYGRRELSLPGGAVKDGESVIEALMREVTAETGLEIASGSLLYAFELVNFVQHDLELIFEATTNGVPSLNGFRAIDLREAIGIDLRPPIVDELVRDLAAGWRDNPRWLGNLAHSTARPRSSGEA